MSKKKKHDPKFLDRLAWDDEDEFEIIEPKRPKKEKPKT